MLYNERGAGTFDFIYVKGDPPTDFVIVEAKGGAATNSWSRKTLEGRFQEGTRRYAQDIAAKKAMETYATGDNVAGDHWHYLFDTVEAGDARYLEITQGYAKDGNLAPIAVREYLR